MVLKTRLDTTVYLNNSGFLEPEKMHWFDRLILAICVSTAIAMRPLSSSLHMLVAGPCHLFLIFEQGVIVVNF